MYCCGRLGGRIGGSADAKGAGGRAGGGEWWCSGAEGVVKSDGRAPGSPSGGCVARAVGEGQAGRPGAAGNVGGPFPSPAGPAGRRGRCVWCCSAPARALLIIARPAYFTLLEGISATWLLWPSCRNFSRTAKEFPNTTHLAARDSAAWLAPRTPLGGRASTCALHGCPPACSSLFAPVPSAQYRQPNSRNVSGNLALGPRSACGWACAPQRVFWEEGWSAAAGGAARNSRCRCQFGCFRRWSCRGREEGWELGAGGAG